MATYYVDGVNGSDTNTGTAPGSGNAWGTIGKATSTAAAGDFIHIRATATYVLTASATCANGGSTSAGPIIYEGYTTTPGARDGRPLITSSVSGLNLIGLNGKGLQNFRHLRFTHTGSSRGGALISSGADAGGGLIEDCLFDGCSTALAGTGGYLTAGWAILNSEIKNCTGSGADSNNALVDSSIFRNNGNHGLGSGNTQGFFLVRRSIFANNGGIGLFQATNFGLSGIDVDSSIFAGNASDGLRINEATAGGGVRFRIRNCVFHGNGGYGVVVGASGAVLNFANQINRNNAYGSNTSGARSNWPAGIGDVALTANPFVDGAAGNFAPNSVAGGGALLRAAGFPGVFAGGATTSYPDLGAVQHQDGGGAGAFRFVGLNGGF